MHILQTGHEDGIARKVIKLPQRWRNHLCCRPRRLGFFYIMCLKSLKRVSEAVDVDAQFICV